MKEEAKKTGKKAGQKERQGSRRKQDRKGSKKGMFSDCLFVVRLAMRLNPAVFRIRIPLILLNVVRVYIPILFLRLILNGIVEGRERDCLLYTAAVSGAMFLSGCLAQLLEIRSETETELTLKMMNNHIGEAVMKLSYAQVEQPKVRDFIEMAKEGNNLSEIFGSIAAFLMNFLTVLGLGAVILTVQPVIILLIVLIVVIRMWSDKRNRGLWEKWRPRYTPIMRKVGYLNRIMVNTEYGKEIRLNQLSDWIYQKVTDGSRVYLKAAYSHNVELQRNNGISELTAVIQEAAVYLVLAYRVVFAGMSIGDFSMYLSSINSFSSGIRGMVEAVSSLMQYNLFASELRQCLDQTERYQEGADSAEDGAGSGKSRQGSGLIQTLKRPFTLEFCHVSFSYPQSDRLVLDDISLTLKEGESLSIVGVNGAGKTTFVRLLCRFYEPTKGKILLNGVDISTIPFAEYASLLGVVFQDYRLFAFSMEENITMGLPPSGHSVSECVEQSGLSSRLASLPKGLETNLSKEFDEEGVEFSGGEGQKLALARVLYKNASILVLDEPTAALDPLAEYEMYSRFHELVKGKCAVYISHRLSSTKFTDRIAVFSDGKLAEYGDHKKLMQIPEGIYAQMFRMQAQYYI